ncbi:MAG: GvpL/GvpF family gas vesicle protein [bacterium]|jgi:hypothetical protein
MSQGIYLFCLTPENPLLKIEGAGIDESQPLYAERVAGVVAILASVSLEEFCGAEAREKMAELPWVAPRARRHEEVILAIQRQAPVLPVRFGSVFSSREALVAAIERHSETLAHFFRETAGQQEWALKAFVDKPQAKSRLMSERRVAEQAQLNKLSPGKRYLFEQKLKGLVAQEITSWLNTIAAELILFFKDVFSASGEGRLLSQELTGRSEEMFAHVVLLVPDGAAERLQQLTDEWNARHETMGLLLEASGPWPPYHFTPVLEM